MTSLTILPFALDDSVWYHLARRTLPEHAGGTKSEYQVSGSHDRASGSEPRAVRGRAQEGARGAAKLVRQSSPMGRVRTLTRHEQHVVDPHREEKARPCET